jgi:phosphoglycerate kinase
MNFNKKTIRDIDIDKKRVLLRVDYNVPTDRSNNVTDDRRIRASLPTLQYLLDHRARVIICSHFGRPNGQIVESMRLAPIANHLARLLGKSVNVLSDCVGTEVEKATSHMNIGEVVLLENLRFHQEEEINELSFAALLAKLADIYVNDAFGASHRSHASIVGVTRYLPSVAGFLMEKELNFLGRLLSNPEHPFIAMMGGAKVSDKLGVIQNIMDKVDALLIGGGMAANFLKAQGHEVGSSALEEDKLDYIKDMIEKAQSMAVRLLLPTDVIVSEKLDGSAPFKIVSVGEIPAAYAIVDIGPESTRNILKEIRGSKTVFWNGPMGIFEIDAFREGTKSIARALVENTIVSIVGGGSTVEAVEKLGVANKITHVSTGGGASLDFLAGIELPGLTALQDK